MLPNKFEMPLDLALKPSKILFRYFLIVVIFSIAGIILSENLSLVIRFCIFVVLLFAAVNSYKNLAVQKIAEIRIKEDTGWELMLATNEIVTAELYGECIVTYFLVWLNFITVTGEKYHVLLFPDSAEKEQLRFLRARLRL